jgi:ferredoxin-NADP reductase
MAIPKVAVVQQSSRVGADAHFLQLQAEEPLGFVGGQYLIVDSGLVLDNGKAAKRAYSPLSADTEQRRFELLVKRIPGGLCSDFMHGLEVGDSVRFSGPWGKFVAPEAASGRTLVLATDTGVTAALGLLGSTRFRALVPSTLFLWLRVDGADFVSDSFVQDRVPRGCAELRTQAFPPVNHPERLPVARSLLAPVFSANPLAHAFVCGDGVINYGLMEDFAAHGVNVSRDNVESFFNMPKKSV